MRFLVLVLVAALAACGNSNVQTSPPADPCDFSPERVEGVTDQATLEEIQRAISDCREVFRR